MVAPGRVFANWLCNAMMGLKAPYHRVRISIELKSDFKMWISFLSDFNGVTFLRDDM